MKTTLIKIPYGRTFLRCRLPAGRLVALSRQRCAPRTASRSSSRALIADALKQFDRKKSSWTGKNILIVVSDLTRHAHVKEIIGPLLRKIGRGAGKIDIIVGTGLHRKHTRRELEALLGAAVVKRYPVLAHELGSSDLVDFGMTDGGTPRLLDRRLMGRDLVISIGVIEPHLYAGYSGGVKTVAIGLAGEATISATHGTRFLDDRSVRIGVTARNAFQQELWKIAEGIVPRWLAVNVVNDPDGRLVRVFCGEVRAVFAEGVRYAKKLFEAKMRRPVDIVICGIGHPKDVNLYQASRAMNYILDVERPIVRKGGVVIIAAQLEEGLGKGLSEQRFGREFARMGSPAAYMQRIKKAGCRAGIHRAYMVARALDYARCVFVTRSAQRFSGAPFPVFADMKDALAYAEDLTSSDARIAVVPRALCTIATVA